MSRPPRVDRCIPNLSVSERAVQSLCEKSGMGGTGHWPVPSGDPPDGLHRGFLETPAQLPTPLPLFRSASRPFPPFFTQALHAASVLPGCETHRMPIWFGRPTTKRPNSMFKNVMFAVRGHTGTRPAKLLKAHPCAVGPVPSPGGFFNGLLKAALLGLRLPAGEAKVVLFMSIIRICPSILANPTETFSYSAFPINCGHFVGPNATLVSASNVAWSPSNFSWSVV